MYTKTDVGLVAPDSNLQSLLTFSELVHDSKGDALKFGRFGENAATVSAGVLMAALKSNDTSDVGAIEGAMAYEECDSDHCETEDERLQCVIDKAFVNLGAMMSERVDGKVSVEVDVHAANNADAIVNKTKKMRDMFDELKVARDKILYKIPCTWQGVQAVKTLENEEGIACHVTQVYSVEQAAAAAAANASLIQVYVARVKTWYDNHPEEAENNNLVGVSDAGVELVRQTTALISKGGHKAKVIAASIRSADEAMALAGCDYILINDRVIDELNRGTPSSAIAANCLEGASCPDVGDVSEAAFQAALEGSPAAEELKLGLEGSKAAEDRLKDYLRERVMPGAGQ